MTKCENLETFQSEMIQTFLITKFPESIPFYFETHVADVQTLPNQAIGPPNLHLLHGNFSTPINCY